MSERYQITESIANQIYNWIQNREGVNVWSCVNLSKGPQDLLMPVIDQGGVRDSKPSYDAGKILRVITKLEDLEVVTAKEVKRFYVAVRMGTQGFSLKITDGAKRNIDRALAKYEDSWYDFDYSTQEAVIFVPGEVVPMEGWVDKNVSCQAP